MKDSNSKSSALRAAPAAFNTRLFDHKAINDWGELKAHLVSKYGLEDVSISLKPDYVGSETFESYESVEITEVGDEAVLLSLSLGYRVCLCVHLFKGDLAVGVEERWQPRSEYRAIMICAKEVFSRVVRDRVVELMSSRGKVGVVSFFLDAEGRVESASGHASAFCEEHLPLVEREGDYFPLAYWDYIEGAIARSREPSAGRFTNGSIVFSFFQESGIVNCLLQKMGGSGYLLSLSLD